MRKNLLISTLLILHLLAGYTSVLAASLPLKSLSENLRGRIEAAGSPVHMVVADEPILASQVLPRFYEQHGFRPAWLSHRGMIPGVSEYVDSLSKAGMEGLDPQDYHFSRIKELILILKKTDNITTDYNRRLLVDLDLLLTDSYLLYASHLMAGAINPTTIDPEWRANRRELDLAETLSTALTKKRISGSLFDLLPPQEGYRRLRSAYQFYRALQAAGESDIIESGDSLKKGQTGVRVEKVRRRLVELGYSDLKEKDDVFDQHFEDVIRTYQSHHGLPVTGVIGPETINDLNISAADRVEQIMVNLERWRWLPQDLGQRHILINIANFELDVNEEGTTVLKMRVIAGKYYRRTPVFSDFITYVVLNPYWHVPKTIAVKDILPLVQKDANYLSQKRIRVFTGTTGNLQEVDPALISWKDVTEEKFPYRFRQDPGPQNALGKVKFMFPNDFDVYLHDTSSPELFTRDLPRTFSSGCIRIEKPMELLAYLTKNNSRYSEKQIKDLLNTGQEATVKLNVSVPIHLLYWTAWVDSDGVVQFREDVYGRDKKLLNALKKHPPSI